MSVSRAVFPTAQAAAAAAARDILTLLDEARSQRGVSSIAVSGGSTPKLMFDAMAQAKFNWSAVHLFWVDERAVPPSDDQSNFKLAAEHLIHPAGIPDANVHRVQAEQPPSEAAQRYVDDIRGFFHLRSNEIPRFDVVHCGMGPDCHTASLFPGEPLIEDRENIAAAVFVEKMRSWRITLLPGVLLAAENIVVLAAGADKTQPLRQVFHGPVENLKCPAQLLNQGAGNTRWFIDAVAAANLE